MAEENYRVQLLSQKGVTTFSVSNFHLIHSQVTIKGLWVFLPTIYKYLAVRARVLIIRDRPDSGPLYELMFEKVRVTVRGVSYYGLDQKLKRFAKNYNIDLFTSRGFWYLKKNMSEKMLRMFITTCYY